MLKRAIKNGKVSLVDAIIEGIRRKKGVDIVNLDLKGINNTECDNFIICHGNSNTHVDAIARSVEECVEEFRNEPAWHRDGFANAQWILLDYIDVMVHIFQEPYRRLYDLEELWGDGILYNIEADI